MIEDYKNKILLKRVYGNDLIVAEEAWTSTTSEITEDMKKRVPEFIEMLWSSNPVPHKSPFEKGAFQFSVTADVASHIHLIKHRTANANGESARYKEIKEDKTYLPEDWKGVLVKDPDLRLELSRMGLGLDYDTMEWYDVLKQLSKLSNKLYHTSLAELADVLGRKRAKESSRFFKMYNNQSMVSIQFNLSAFYTFLEQRKDFHAQDEIHGIATEMLKLVEQEGSYKYSLRSMRRRILRNQISQELLAKAEKEGQINIDELLDKQS